MQMKTRKRSNRWARMPVAIMMVLGLMLAAVPVSADESTDPVTHAGAGLANLTYFEWRITASTGKICGSSPSTIFWSDIDWGSLDWCVDTESLSGEYQNCWGRVRGSGGYGTIWRDDEEFELDELSLTRDTGLEMTLVARYTHMASGAQGEFTLEGRNGCVYDGASSAKGYLEGIARMTPDTVVGASEDGCEDSTGQVGEPVSGEFGDESDPDTHGTYDVRAHRNGDIVEVCAEVSQGGERHRRVVKANSNPGDPPEPPVHVDDNAPPGDGPGSPCTKNVYNSNSPRLQIRRSSENAEQQVICVGVPGRNVRVTVG